MNSNLNLFASLFVLIAAMIGLWAAVPYSGWVLLASIIGFLTVIDDDKE